MTFQGPTGQLALLEIEPTAALEPRRRTRGKGRPKPDRRWKQPPLANARLKVVNTAGDADPCSSGPGICMVLHCRKNLIGWLTGSGNYHVPPVADHDGMTLPVDTAKFGGSSKQGSRPVTPDDLDECTIMVLRRALFLERVAGTTCRLDLPDRMDQRVMGLILGVSRQRVGQIESGATRKLKRSVRARELHEMHGEDVKPWRNTGRTSAKRNE